jgi:hypothetical protein
VEKSTTVVEETMRRKMSSAHNKFEDIFQMAKTLEEGMDILIQNLESLSLLFQPNMQTTQEEQENFIGMSIPEDVQVHPPNVIRSKGKCKRILGHGDRNKKKKGHRDRNKKKRILVQGNAQHVKMLAMIDAIVQTKMFLHFRTHIGFGSLFTGVNLSLFFY